MYIKIQHPEYIMFSSDYSQQEPKTLACVSKDPKMSDAFKHGRDIYATIASVAFNVPYEQCLEFHPETGEYQKEGKERRSQAKSIVLGITYGRSTVTIGEQLFGRNHDMTDEDKTRAAQHIYDSVLKAFPALKGFMQYAQDCARTKGYTETILGRRRHIPDMQLPEFEFKAMPGYVNPDVDPLDVSTLKNSSEIPERIVNQLTQEFSKLKYYGQIVKKTKELREQKIKVINNRRKIQDATRQCVNSIIQGSAADLTKMAILNLEYNERWHQIGGRLLVPVHDELICEVPVDFYEEGRALLKDAMESAGNFMPFPISCDVETTLRWYGMSYPCEYKRPVFFSLSTIHDMDPEEIKWIQWHLIECEYQLPVFADENGDDPIGDEAKGVNGIVSDEFVCYVEDLMNRLNIDDKSFIDYVDQVVVKGLY